MQTQTNSPPACIRNWMGSICIIELSSRLVLCALRKRWDEGLERREPLPQERRWPGYVHDVLEHERDGDNQHGRVGDDERPAFAVLVAHEEHHEESNRRNETD